MTLHRLATDRLLFGDFGMQAARVFETIARWAPPLLVPVVMVAAWLAGPEAHAEWVSDHGSHMEDALGIALFIALISGLYALFRPETQRHKHLRGWLAVWCLGVFYFLGEDLNWGQYIFGWQPNEFFLTHNKEAETNLHNMSPWFNQKPRIMVQLWILVAGVLVPLGWSWPRRATAEHVPGILWPGRRTTMLALVTTLIPALEWIARTVFGPDLGGAPIRFSEIQEFFFAWFFLLYAIDLAGRLRAPQEARMAQAAARTPAK